MKSFGGQFLSFSSFFHCTEGIEILQFQPPFNGQDILCWWSFGKVFLHAGWWVSLWFIKQFYFDWLCWETGWSLWGKKKVIPMKDKSISLSFACTCLSFIAYDFIIYGQWQWNQDFSLNVMIQQSWSKRKYWFSMIAQSQVGFFPSCLKLGRIFLKDWMVV